MRDIPAILCSDVPQEKIAPGFDEVRQIAHPERSFADKIPPLLESPFEKTIFLDTDTFVCAPLDDIFLLLDRFDFLAAHAPMRVTWPQQDIPDVFPEVNSGVMAWRKSARTDSLFSAWKRLYCEHVRATGQTDDQPALRRALYESDLRIGILPPEYNFRTVLPAFAGRAKVKIIHGRHADMADVERRLNRHQCCRAVLPGDRQLAPDSLVVLGGGIRFLAAPLQWLAAGWFRAASALTKLKRRLFR